MTPEERARQQIDRQLSDCGWQVQDRWEMDIFAGTGVAVREFPLKRGHGEADYLLYADTKAIGIIEAKPAGHTLTGVETQSNKYTTGLPDFVPRYRLPLPFSYEATGAVTQFTNALEPDARSREVFAFHRAEELLRLVRLDRQVRDNLRQMPPLVTENLWPAQIQAIENLERSLALNRPRSLIQMATGSGKTFTAVSFAYRLIKYAGAKRVLFLVDRKNLGNQTLTEFQRYVSPYTGRTFTDEYNVQHLRSNTIDPVSRVCITTVQRLYSMLRGEEEFEEQDEEGSLFERATPLTREPLPVAYNPRIPIETFDYIVVDECHRSIYNLWRQVLEYFDAPLIGLTATPSKQTIGFFGGNLVMEYGHEQAVADGVNVGFEVYRIRTRITEQGATMEADPEFYVPRRDRQTRARRYAALDDDLTYTANQLDRDVVSEQQLRLVVRTFRERLFTEIFPNRTEVPKTLVFAKDDSHADDITRIIREEFGKGNEFCQKITYRTTGKRPEELLAEFRNSYNPRIAVSVDMIATGTDVKPLECLLFLRNVRSANYFEQMKGRGVRIVDKDTLQGVTPDAEAKTHFVMVDAVGVSEQDKTESQPLERQRSVSFEKLLESVAMGNTQTDVVSSLAGRLARLERRLDAEQRSEIAQAAGGRDLRSLTAGLIESLDPDRQVERARETLGLAPDQQPESGQVDEAREAMIREALRPFSRPALRDRIIAIKQSFEQVVDESSRDELLHAGFDVEALERDRSLVKSFRQFIEDNRGEIEALQVLYSRPRRAGLRFRQIKELAKAIERPPLGATPERLWQAFRVVEPEAVRGNGGKQLADVVALVRHAIEPTEPLAPYAETVEERYARWLEEQEAAGAIFTPEQCRWLDAIKDHIASSLRIERDDFDYAPFSQLGGLGRVHAVFGNRLPTLLDELNERLAA